MTSGAIQAYVPAALILVVRCHSRARPKSVIFRILLLRSPFSTFWRINTGPGKEYKETRESALVTGQPPNAKPSGTHCPPLCRLHHAATTDRLMVRAVTLKHQRGTIFMPSLLSALSPNHTQPSEVGTTAISVSQKKLR